MCVIKINIENNKLSDGEAPFFRSTRPEEQKHHVPQKYSYLFTKAHDDKFQKIEIIKVFGDIKFEANH
jgi:hypothetical protein